MATATELQQLYVAYFGRPADPAGLDYWVSTGISTKAFAALMFAQPEFQSVNSGLSVEAQVNQIYINLFGRNADNAGLLYWTQQINTGKLQLASIANDLIFACNKGAASAADIAALNNKTATALAYTADIRANQNALLAYQPQATNPWVSGANFATAVSFMNTATATNQPTAAQITASVATIAANGAPGQTITLTTDKFSYIGGPGNDTFIAGTTAANVQVLSAADSIDGGGGTNRLIATLTQVNSSVGQLTNVQNVSVTQTVNNGTLNLANSTGVTSYTNNGSNFDHTISGLGQSTAFAWSNTSNADFTIALNGVTGTSDAVTVSLTNVVDTDDLAANSTDLVIAGVETVNLVSNGSVTNVLSDLFTAAATTLNISGSAGLSVTNGLQAATTTINAGTATGNITLESDGGNATITGGTGNDQFTLANVAGNASVSTGAGNDTIIFAGEFTNADTVDGGTGSNTLRVTAANAEGYVAPATATLSNIQTLDLSSAGTAAATLTLANLSTGISTVGLRAGTAGAYTINGPATSLTVNVGAAGGGSALGNGVLTINDTGIATVDALTINNVNAAATNAFAGRALTLNGYESVTLNTGASATAAQTAGAITVTPDQGAATTLTINGANSLTITNGNSITAGTINASGLTGTAAFSMGDTAATGATSIVGSANGDTLLASSVAATIDGGAGADVITSGANGDTILGGEGNDTITAGTGNDSIDAGAGDDRVLIAGAGLTAADTISGGAGANTFVLTDNTAVAAAAGARVSNFGALEFTANTVSQDLAAFSATTFTSVTQSNASRALTLTNASASLNTLNVNQVASINTNISRATDTTSDALTVNAVQGIAAASALTASNEETVTINASTFGVDLDLATMTDLTTLNLTGSGAGQAIVIDAQAATLLATVNAAAVSGTNTLNVDATDSTVALTFTGGSNSGGTTVASGSGNDVITAGVASASVIDGGLGNDSITGSTQNDSLSGAGGADTLVGGGGADTLNGGSGNDSLLGGDGDDVIETSAGADTIDGGAGTNTISVSAGAQDLSIYSISNATTLNMNARATTLSIAQYDAFTAINNQAAVTFSNAGTVTGKLGLTTYNLANGTNTFNAQADAAAATSVTGGTGVDTFNFTVANFQTAGASTVVGGTGNDTLNIAGNTALTVANSGTRVLGVETITVGNTTNNVSWTQSDNITSGGVVQFLDATGMTTGTLVFDGSAQTSAGQQFIVTKGGSGTANLLGGDNADTLTGGSGNDTINGGIGSDSVVGGAGDDQFYAAGTTQLVAADTIAGGLGNNQIVLDNRAGAVTVNVDFDNISDVLAINVLDADGSGAGAQNVTVTFSAITETTAQVVSLDASVITDTSDALAVTNSAASATTTFSITGGAGQDTLAGSNGADTLSGGGSADTITGGAGIDVITGGEGANNITGGTGGDVINLTQTTAARDTLNYSAGDTAVTIEGTGNNGTIAGFDSITGFNVGTTANDKDTLNVPTVLIASNTAGTDGTDSTLTVGGQTLKSYAITSGLITFDDADTFSTAVTLTGQGGLAAATQFLLANDLGNAGAAVVFTVGGTDGFQGSYFYSQTDSVAGGVNGDYILAQLFGVSATGLETTASATANLVFIS